MLPHEARPQNGQFNLRVVAKPTKPVANGPGVTRLRLAICGTFRFTSGDLASAAIMSVLDTQHQKKSATASYGSTDIRESLRLISNLRNVRPGPVIGKCLAHR